MQYRFVHFDAGTLGRKSRRSELGHLAREKHLLERVDNLAFTAFSLYAGSLPVESLTSQWGAAERLPWHKRYWRGKPSSDQVRFPVDEVCTYLYELEDDALVNRWGRAIEAFGGGRELVQALAVETVMFLDRALVCLIQGKGLEAASWLAGSYEAMLDAVNVVSEDFPEIWQFREREREGRGTA